MTDAHADEDQRGEADVVVLPWWQRPANILTLVVATALIAAMLGWLIGDATSEPDGGEVDTGFLQDMRVHHEQAFRMSMIYLDRPETDPGLRVVAQTIVFGQSIEIGRMVQLLRQLGAPGARDESTPAMQWMAMSMPSAEMPGMASEAQLDQLAGARGRRADALFVRLMTAHHRGGIDMAEFAAKRADNDEVRALATSMVRAQRSDIVEMEGLLDG